METLKFTLNGNLFVFSKSTGALVLLKGNGCGEIIKGGRGLIDIAWPLKYKYEILRADPCGKHKSCSPVIAGDDNQVTLTWTRLPLNTYVPDCPELDGGIWAQVTLKACEDGCSVSMKCRVVNNSLTAIRQVLFPDFSGLHPLAGKDTRFTGLKGYSHPFRELADEGDMKNQFYAAKPSLCGKFYSAGGYFDDIRVGRYYDFGGLNGGMTLFCKHWGWGPDDPNAMGQNDVVWVKLNNIENTLRIANVHYTTIEHGDEYESAEYILTPHAGGWVQGIGPYKSWVNANKKRAVPVPQNVREALGFRTIWATEQYPDDPDSAIWPYDQYPLVADDMVEHGLYRLNIWAMCSWTMPLTPERFYENQGGLETLKRSIELMSEKGVKCEALVSWLSIWAEMRERYGLPFSDGAEAGWTENLKGVPMFRTPYMERFQSTFLWNQENELWIKDVKNALRFLRDQLGIDICWDQYFPGKSVVYDIIDEYRKETYELYPESAFSGESTFFFEADIDHLDYTWNWIYRNSDMGQDTAPYSHVVETTRPQMIIDSNPVYLKYCFMDNVMINVYPSKPESINGSALICEVPELSKALKQCAALRKAYLRYFTDGTQLGDCILTEDCTDARISGYLLAGNMLVFAVKHNDKDAVINLDFVPFGGVGQYSATVFDANNCLIREFLVSAREQITISGEKDELFILEFRKR